VTQVPTPTPAPAHDTLFGGAVVLHQPSRNEGYRVNVDALLLAAFAVRSGRPARVAFDLGAGVGAVGLSLLHLAGAKRVVLLELDERAAAMAEANLRENGWSTRGEVLRGDATTLARAHRGAADLVVCNPPYVEPGKGRMPLAIRAQARRGGLGAFVDAARVVAARRARVCFVYPAREALALFAELRRAGLEPKRLRAVHATATSPARVVLVESLAAKPGGLVVEPPLLEREGSTYSKELTRLLTSRRGGDPG
jgi:tRNA1Val (adenine37-N6)-methyltransferase